ncbi:MAG: UDPglucose--hexose-phosphate uridylyltransferase [Actinomycetota bacterium]|nr:UDPglucose--hexose-phosphate uridylyltransferase [Actinomycetota bacterium]
MTSGPEFRFDALTREWVNIVGHRQGRPNLPGDDCPFCPGGLEAPEPYDVRWFENRWPALTSGAAIDVAAAEAAGTARLPAVGACEIVLFSPQHDQSLAGLGAGGVRKVVDVWAARTEALLARPDIEYVLVFENRGREVGATIDHPHGQIYGYPFVPPIPAREAAIAHEHGCSLCREVQAEAAAGTRVVYDDGTWLAWVPYASSYPYGLRIAPRAHRPSIPALDGADRDALSALLTDVLARYDRLWPSPHFGYLFPYLLWFHQAPASGGDEWHLHAHVAPPLRAPGVPRFVASSESGSGTLSNPIVPEDAADALRNA